MLHELDAVCDEALPQSHDSVTVGETNAEVQPVGAGDRIAGRAEGEREATVVVEHEDAIVVAPCRPRAEPEVALIEAARALLVANRDRQVVHSRRRYPAVAPDRRLAHESKLLPIVACDLRPVRRALSNLLALGDPPVEHPPQAEEPVDPLVAPGRDLVGSDEPQP